MLYKHAYLNTLLLLHYAFVPSVVKMPLKGEVGGRALNSHGNYIDGNHGIVFLNFYGNPEDTYEKTRATSQQHCKRLHVILVSGIRSSR